MNTTHQPQARQTASQAAHGPDLIQLHAQACNNLHGALKLLTDTSTSGPDSEVFSRALGRALRATSALKQACAEVNGGAA
jgi:hypothetical protein